MPGTLTSGRKSRKKRRQLWIAAVAGSMLLSGLFFGTALDAGLLASGVGKTPSFEEGWKPFHDHLSQLSERSAWIGLVFFLLAAFALPRARHAVRRYFSTVNFLQPRPGMLLLCGIWFASAVAGFLMGTTMDRLMTAINLSGSVR